MGKSGLVTPAPFSLPSLHLSTLPPVVTKANISLCFRLAAISL